MSTYLPQGTNVIDASTHAIIETWGSTSMAMRRASEMNTDDYEFTPSDSPGDYLVVEDPKKKATWHLQVKVNGKPDHKLMGAAKAALTSPGGHRGQKYSGPNKSEALTKLKKLYERENMQFSGEIVFLLDPFVTTRPGDPYRLFPFGVIHKSGVEHNITREYAMTFKLPPFKPPIKLGSHDEATPAGGHIIKLEVRADDRCVLCAQGQCKTHGLFAVPELLPGGSNAFVGGAYRYHSPEVIWDDQGLEDPATGDLIPGPMIVGDALLHTPHLGEAVALYSIEPFPTGAKPMSQVMDENITMPRSFLERLFGIQPKPAVTNLEPGTPGSPSSDPPPIVVAESEAFKAAVRERDELKAKIAKIEAETQRKTMLAAIVTELQSKDKFGMVFINVTEAEQAAAMLASMTPECKDWCMKTFSALIHQIDESHLTGEIGVTGASGGPGTTDNTAATAFDAAVKARAKKDKVPYEAAFKLVSEEAPDLFRAYLKER